MASDDTGPWGNPRFLAGGAPDVAVDPNNVSDYYVNKTIRRFDTLAHLKAAAGAQQGYWAAADDVPGTIWYYDGTDWLMRGTAVFPDVTTANSVLTAPVQGMRRRRGDVPYEELYYASYNAGTNPFGTSVGGTPTAGWFPAPGADIWCAVSKSGLSLATGTPAAFAWDTEEFDGFGWHTGTSTQILPTIPGRYDLDGEIEFAGNTAGSRGSEIRKNSTAGIPSARIGTPTPNGTSAGYTLRAAKVLMNGTTDFIDMTGAQNSGGALIANARLIARYAGAPIGA